MEEPPLRDLAARRERLERVAGAARSILEVLPHDDPRRAHFEAQHRQYQDRAEANGRRLAAYLDRRAELVAERAEAGVLAAEAAERQAEQTKEATALRFARRYAEARTADDEAAEHRSDAYDWRHAAARAQAELRALRRPIG